MTLRIALDLGGRADRDRRAVVEHVDALADAHDDLHVVLDEQDRHAEAGRGSTGSGP